MIVVTQHSLSIVHLHNCIMTTMRCSYCVLVLSDQWSQYIWYPEISVAEADVIDPKRCTCLFHYLLWIVSIKPKLHFYITLLFSRTISSNKRFSIQMLASTIKPCQKRLYDLINEVQLYLSNRCFFFKRRRNFGASKCLNFHIFQYILVFLDCNKRAATSSTVSMNSSSR